MSEDEELLRAEIARLRAELEAVRLCFADASHSASATTVHVETLKAEVEDLKRQVWVESQNKKFGWETARASDKAYDAEHKKRLAAEQERDAALVKLGRIALAQTWVP